MVDDCLESPEANKFSLRKRLKLPIIMKSMYLNKNDVVLDIGCGAGFFSFEISKFAKKVYGLDYSKININSVKESYKNIKNLHFKLGDATNMPFKDNTFDIILATELIEHIKDDNKLIKECYRVLKNKGRIIITTPCTNPHISVDWFRKSSGINLETDFGHKRAGYTKEQLYKLLKKSNLQPINTLYYDQFFGEIAWIFTCIPRIITNKKAWSSGQDQVKLNKNTLFKIYKLIFPLIFLFAKLDFFLNKLRGHHILIKSIKNKVKEK